MYLSGCQNLYLPRTSNQSLLSWRACSSEEIEAPTEIEEIVSIVLRNGGLYSLIQSPTLSFGSTVRTKGRTEDEPMAARRRWREQVVV